MAKHGPQDDKENLAPDGGVAKAPKSAAAAKAAFEEALRRGNQPDPRTDT